MRPTESKKSIERRHLKRIRASLAAPLKKAIAYEKTSLFPLNLRLKRLDSTGLRRYLYFSPNLHFTEGCHRMIFRSMTAPEFIKFQKRSCLSYAKSLQQASLLTLSAAKKKAKLSFRTHLPQGIKTPHHELYFVFKDKKKVGHIWFGLRPTEQKKKHEAYLFDIEIYPRYQGQGLGKETMLLMESMLRQRKIKTLGLHVFGYNLRAQNLYHQLGFKAQNIVMVKKL